MKNFFASLKGIVVLFCLLSANEVQAQNGQWTWMKGDSTANTLAVFGTKGISDFNNTPGARLGSATWSDSLGNLWLFSGFGKNHAGSGTINDLWKYNTLDNKWTWVHGDSLADLAPVYGTKGVASPVNNPGARGQSINWLDKQGNFWLFGGVGSGTAGSNYLNDLWRYDVLNNTWTWINGDTSFTPEGVYGTKGIASSTNKPGARKSGHGWTDSTGELWLFGGIGVAAGEWQNDLWKYNLSTNRWTWMKGDSLPGSKGMAGALGSSGIDYSPASRQLAASWTDHSNNLWLFGGEGLSIGGSQNSLNDLWKYDINTNKWAWISGDSSAGKIVGSYGVKGVASSTNKPGGRNKGVNWTDNAGNLWLFGGQGYANANIGFLNDLWKFDVSSNQWAWEGGDSSGAIREMFGIKGQPANTNIPAARVFSISWKDIAGNFWLYGGYGSITPSLGRLGDLWKFSPTISLPLHLLTFTAKRANTANLLNWTTAQEVNTDHFDIERSPAPNSTVGAGGREFSKIGTVKANSPTGQYTYTDNTPTRNDPTRNEKQETVVFYRLKMIDKDGQFTYSPIRQINLNPKLSTLNISPNPAKDNIRLQFSKTLAGKSTIKITDLSGKVVLQKTVEVNGSSLSTSTSQLPSGTYTIMLTNNGEEYLQKVVVVR